MEQWPTQVTCNQPGGTSNLPCEAMAHSHKFGVGQAGVESFWGVELPVHDVKEGGRVISQNIVVFDDGRPV